MACSVRCDWLPDVTDLRDLTLASRRVVSLLSRLEPARDRGELPTRVDWREYFGETVAPCSSSAVEACVAMFQYFERRTSGRLLHFSRTFLEFNTARLGASAERVRNFRTLLKAARRCGIPPERHWPAARGVDEVPDPFCYCFRRYFGPIRYFRLDGPQPSGEETLGKLRALLAAGFTAVFGIAASSAVGGGPDIALPTLSEELYGGLAVLAVGYDDRLRIRSDKGALLVRSPLGPTWGDGGYGWLPYAYVRQRLATDFWTVIKPSWVRSGEFNLPTL